MTQPHLYLSHGTVIKGTPVSREEFAEMTRIEALARHEEIIFLKDVTILGHNGATVNVDFFMLTKAAVSGVGNVNIHDTSSEERMLSSHA